MASCNYSLKFLLYICLYFCLFCVNVEVVKAAPVRVTSDILGEFFFSQCECEDGSTFSDTSSAQDVGSLTINSNKTKCPEEAGFAPAARQGVVITDDGQGSTNALSSAVASGAAINPIDGFTIDMWIRPIGFSTSGSMTLVDIRGASQAQSLPGYLCGIRYSTIKPNELVVYYGSDQLQNVYDFYFSLGAPLSLDTPMHIACGWRTVPFAPFACVNGVCQQDTGFSGFTPAAFEADAKVVLGLTVPFILFNFPFPVNDVELITATIYDTGLSDSDVQENSQVTSIISHFPAPSNTYSKSSFEDVIFKPVTLGDVNALFFDEDGNNGDAVFNVYPSTIGSLSLNGAAINSVTQLDQVEIVNLTFTPDQNYYTSDSAGSCSDSAEFVPMFEFEVLDVTDQACILGPQSVQVCVQGINDKPIAAITESEVIDKGLLLTELTFTVGSDVDDIIHNQQSTDSGLSGGRIEFLLNDLEGTLYEYTSGCAIQGTQIAQNGQVSLTGENVTICFKRDPASVNSNGGVGNIIGSDRFGFRLFDKANLQSDEDGFVNITIVNLVRTCTSSCEATTEENTAVNLNISAEIEGQELFFVIKSKPSNGILAYASNPAVELSLNENLTSIELVYTPEQGYYNLNNLGIAAEDVRGESICPQSQSSCPDTFVFTASAGDSANDGQFNFFVKSVENIDTIISAQTTYGFAKGEKISVTDIFVNTFGDGDMNEIKFQIAPPPGVLVKVPNADNIQNIAYQNFPGGCTKGDFCGGVMTFIGAPSVVNAFLSQMQFTSNEDSLATPQITFTVTDIDDSDSDRASDIKVVNINYGAGDPASSVPDNIIAIASSALAIFAILFAALMVFRYRNHKRKMNEVEVKEELPPIPDEPPKMHKPVPPNHPSVRRNVNASSTQHGSTKKQKLLKPKPPTDSTKRHQPAPPKESAPPKNDLTDIVNESL